MSRKNPRREPRFELRKPEVIEVIVERADDAVAATAQGQLCDISRGGAKLLIDQRLPLQTAVGMRLQNAGLHLDLAISGEVCWILPAPDDQWVVGCTFVPGLPGDILEKLFASGLLERRIFSRRALRVPAKAQWELEATATEVFLWDLSEGGFCILSPLARKTGRRLLVSVTNGTDEVRIPAKTQWDLKVGEGYIVGCEFINKEGYLLLRDLQEEASGGQRDRRRSDRRTFRTLVDCFLKSPAREAVSA